MTAAVLYIPLVLLLSYLGSVDTTNNPVAEGFMQFLGDLFWKGFAAFLNGTTLVGIFNLIGTSCSTIFGMNKDLIDWRNCASEPLVNL